MFLVHHQTEAHQARVRDGKVLLPFQGAPVVTVVIRIVEAAHYPTGLVEEVLGIWRGAIHLGQLELAHMANSAEDGPSI